MCFIERNSILKAKFLFFVFFLLANLSQAQNSHYQIFGNDTFYLKKIENYSEIQNLLKDSSAIPIQWGGYDSLIRNSFLDLLSKELENSEDKYYEFHYFDIQPDILGLSDWFFISRVVAILNHISAIKNKEIYFKFIIHYRHLSKDEISSWCDYNKDIMNLNMLKIIDINN